MKRLLILPLLLAASITAHARAVPAAVIDSCLLFDRATDASVSIAPIEGAAELVDEVSVSGYELFTPASDNNALGIGYATSTRGDKDYIFVGPYRGYVMQAVAVGRFQPKGIDQPSLASYALLRQRGRQYVCVMESNGNGSAAFVRSAYVGRVPPSKGSTLKLFYKVADVKTFKAFNGGKR